MEINMPGTSFIIASDFNNKASVDQLHMNLWILDHSTFVLDIGVLMQIDKKLVNDSDRRLSR